MKLNLACKERISWRGLFLSKFLLLFFFGVFSMQHKASASAVQDNDVGFALTKIGDHQYGANGVGVWLSTGRVRLALANTINLDFDGVGLIESQLSADDLKTAREIQSQLCSAQADQSSHELQVDPLMTYSVRCMQDKGLELHQGRLKDLTKSLALRLDDFFKKTVQRYKADGRTLVKFDISVESVLRQKDNFLISVKFANSGSYPIKIRTPDQWSKVWGERLDVSAFSANGKGEWRADLIGRPVVNKTSLPIEDISLPTGESGTFVNIPERSFLILQFLTVPNDKVPNGTYDFGTLTFTNLSINGISGIGGRVNFTSGKTHSLRVTFDRDYPSTPEEWQDFESRKAKETSFLMPGNPVVEPGYYRAASITGARDQFVRKFEQGTSAPNLDFQRWDRWEWEADLARATICKPGTACPRDGRWILRANDYSHGRTRELTYSQHERRFQMGEPMPVIDVANANASSPFWEWLRNA